VYKIYMKDRPEDNIEIKGRILYSGPHCGILGGSIARRLGVLEEAVFTMETSGRMGFLHIGTKAYGEL
jgi:hypothetical protein